VQNEVPGPPQVMHRKRSACRVLKEAVVRRWSESRTVEILRKQAYPAERKKKRPGHRTSQAAQARTGTPLPVRSLLEGDAGDSAKLAFWRLRGDNLGGEVSHPSTPRAFRSGQDPVNPNKLVLGSALAKISKRVEYGSQFIRSIARVLVACSFLAR
jgi:hypothetical protein